MSKTKIGFLFFLIAVLANCNRDKQSDTDRPVSAVYQKIYGATGITADGTYIYINRAD